MDDLTDRQRRVRDFIAHSLETRGAAPSLREIAARFGVALRAAQKHVAALRRKGALDGEDGRPRSLRPAGWRPSALVPVLGEVRAGLPVLAEQNIESYLAVDRGLVRGAGRLFALRVKGDSMAGAHILEGDTVLVRPQPEASPHDIVVALNEGEATVKYFRLRAGRPFLEAANPRYAPIPAHDFSIIGKVVGLVRNM